MLNYQSGQFVGRKPVTKTFTVELKPIGETRETIKIKKHLEGDGELRLLIEAAAPIIDSCIAKIANRALQQLGKEYSFSKYSHAIKADAEKGEKKAEPKERAKIENLLAKAVKENLPDGCKKLEDLSSAAFIQGYVLDMVAEDAEKRIIIQQLKGKNTLLQRYLTTRKTMLQNWMPKRVFENWTFFSENAEKMGKILESPLAEKIMEYYPDADNYKAMDFYSLCLTQTNIDNYNSIITGEMTEDEVITPSINVLIENYNQEIRGRKDEHPLPRLKKMYKQILMKEEKAFEIAVLTSDEDAKDIIKEVISDLRKEPQKIIDALEDAEPDDIAVCGDRLHVLSNLLYSDHNQLSSIILEAEEKRLNNLFENAEKKEKTAIKKQIEGLEKTIRKGVFTFKALSEFTGDNILRVYTKELKEAEKNLAQKEKAAKSIAESKNEKIRGSRANIIKIKKYFTAWTDFRNLIGIIRRKSEEDINSDFYDVFDNSIYLIKRSFKGENLVRNYVTKKAGTDLHYEDATFGSALRANSQWWTPGEKFSKTMQTILKKDGRLYYFILPDGTAPVKLEDPDGDVKCLQSRKLANPSAAIPRLVFKAPAKFFDENPEENEFIFTSDMRTPITITREAYEAYRNKTYTVDKVRSGEITEEKFKDALTRVLTVYRDFLVSKEIYADMDFGLKDPSAYKDAGEFMSAVSRHNCIMRWANVNQKTIEDLVKTGNGLLFEMTTYRLKNFHKTGDKKYLRGYETILLEILSDKNLSAMKTLLNSRPSLLYRTKLTTPKYGLHKAGSVMVNRYDSKGEYIVPSVHDQLVRFYNGKMKKEELNGAAIKWLNKGTIITQKFDFDIAKQDRYYREHFAVRFAFTANADCVDTSASLNAEIREEYSDSNRVIVVRNVSDILYMVVQNKDGKIIKKQSLNIIDDGKRETDWKERFRKIQAEREEGRNEWDYSRTSDDLKDVYLNYAIKEIAQTVLEYNAILIIEKMSERVKDKYSFLEDTAFKKFEGKILSKMSELHFRGIKEGEPGSYTNPLQLARNNPNAILQDGVVFTVPNAQTRNMCPDSGFISDFSYSKIHTKAAEIRFLSKFDELKIDETGALKMKFDTRNFDTFHDAEMTEWICKAKHGITIYDREEKKNKYIEDPISELMAIMQKEGLDPYSEINLLLQNEKISREVIHAIFQLVRIYLNGMIGAHDGCRASYISPVTGKEYDLSLLSAMNLSRKCDFYMIEPQKRGAWIDYTAKLQR